ncbi:uncharacterized protein B0H18DRAFT_964982 [Fomitopsis serialis]|uniref:uncharacterized protein n=1 Tax=Fomitopsis serialis TaxID=139415 RepID=UPI002007772C|nr:uncharacterized protein B0H18DRAFT_964982 [Neoantrodia serialis]KAH9904249.1 hypothetical protein B0H18DRAFT_964982 [Neoantrodia serialis]
MASVFSNRDRMIDEAVAYYHVLLPKMVAWSACLVENPDDFYVRGRHTVGDLMAALRVLSFPAKGDTSRPRPGEVLPMQVLADLAEYMDTLESVQIAVANVMTDVHCGSLLVSLEQANWIMRLLVPVAREIGWKMDGYTALAKKTAGGKLRADEWRTPYPPAILYMYTAFLRDEVRTVEEVRAEFRTYLAFGTGLFVRDDQPVWPQRYTVPLRREHELSNPHQVEREFWFAMCAHIQVICASSDVFIGLDARPLDGVPNEALQGGWLQKLGVALRRIERRIESTCQSSTPWRTTFREAPAFMNISLGFITFMDVQDVVQMLTSESSTTELVFWEYQAHSPYPGVPCLPVGMIEGSPGHATWSARQAKHCHRVLAHMLARMAIFESVRFADAGLNAQLTEHLHFCHQRLGWLAAQLEGIPLRSK